MRAPRRSKLTLATGDAMLEHLRCGAFRGDACAAAGIAPRTFRKWERRAIDGEEPFRSFMDDVAQAEAVAVLRLNAIVYAAARGVQSVTLEDGAVVRIRISDWRAAARLLEALAVNTFARVQARRHQFSSGECDEAEAAAARVRAIFAGAS